MLSRKPVFVDLDRRREIVFNLNTEILIREAGKGSESLWEQIGIERDADSGEEKKTLDVNLQNLRVYLWAALQADCRSRGEMLTVEDVGALLTRRKYVTRAVEGISEALQLYYGEDEGEA